MSERYEDSGLAEKWRGRRAGYGDPTRWLINKCSPRPRMSRSTEHLLGI